MKKLIVIFGLISWTASFAQLNEELWNYYLYENQLTDNKVKLIIVERGDIVNLHIRPDGKTQRIVLANSDKSFFGEDKFYYYGDTLAEVLGYRKENLYINKEYKYTDGFLEQVDVYNNKLLTKKFIYGTYTNGWINFITEHVMRGYQEEQTWTKNVKYYEDGFIKAIDYRRGFSYHSKFYVYNKETEFIEKEKIRIFENNQETDFREIQTSTYDNGLTKSITIDGYTQNISYQFFTDNEFTNALDSLNLVESEIKKFEVKKTDLKKQIGTEYEFITKEIISIHSGYKRKIKEAFESSEKLQILTEAVTELNKYAAMDDKELKKLNRELKKKYGTQNGFNW
ncbi:hypothetical protein N7E81_19220 [Reichenbachiella carrageenanivorans]|uniref:Antitoxin component YwqK of the YwqJK toxin-antitoxin module n=1 Tax=Reichenbachiella carrageenanivorans TaxID=2979869 RepID=A0ABY6CZZ2_9BACT|nr:hypothetical protein [Reichenbachiella carrageenanivorans]UXX79481.1 hypothetical protein N7E81_19220 [Reichenbachiella carrageenanivorans]